MPAFKNYHRLQWTVLTTVLLNICINLFSAFGFINGNSVGEISQQYANSFTPAAFTFSIWSIICLSYLIYSVYQVLPRHRDNPVYSELAVPFIFANLLSICWLLLFSFDHFKFSLAVIAVILAIGFIQFKRVKLAIAEYRCRKWITVAFSLFFAWVTIAALANLSAFFVSMHIAAPDAATIIICALVFLSLLINLRYRDWIYPFVICWSCVGIWSENRELNKDVAGLALGSAILLLAWIVIYLVIRTSMPRRLV
jgi:hypothetical protein